MSRAPGLWGVSCVRTLIDSRLSDTTCGEGETNGESLFQLKCSNGMLQWKWNVLEMERDDLNLNTFKYIFPIQAFQVDE